MLSLWALVTVLDEQHLSVGTRHIFRAQYPRGLVAATPDSTGLESGQVHRGLGHGPVLRAKQKSEGFMIEKDGREIKEIVMRSSRAVRSRTPRAA